MKAAAAALALVAALAAGAHAERPTLRRDTGDGLPVKLTVLQVTPRSASLRSGRTGVPWLGPRGGRPAGDGWAAGPRIFSLGGRGEVALPPGTYEVVAGRGPEWTIARERVQLADPRSPRAERSGARSGAALAIRLQRAYDTAGWVAADFHVHADPSTDSAVPLPARAAQLAADGGAGQRAPRRGAVARQDRPRLHRRGPRSGAGVDRHRGAPAQQEQLLPGRRPS